MASAVAALALASSIVQFVSFTGDLISKSHAVSKSASYGLVENLELQAITSTLKELNLGLLRPIAVKTSSTTAEKKLEELALGCSNVAKELLSVLERLNGHERQAKWSSFLQALKSIWKEDQINALSTRLDRYRNQIDTALLMSLRENMASLQDLMTANNSTCDSFQQPSLRELRASVKAIEQWQVDIFRNLSLACWKPPEQLSVELLSTQLSTSTEQRRHEAMKLTILEKLRYANIEDRFERIPTAYCKTFDWIFHHDHEVHLDGDILPISKGKGPENDQAAPLLAETEAKETEVKETEVQETETQEIEVKKVHPKFDSFVNWLCSDQGLYWITGKPGSGKSTLMKYLYGDPRTYQHLKSWKGTLDLIMTGFFF